MTRRRTDDGIENERPERSEAFTYERDPGETPTESVVRAVSAVTDTSPLELEPLYGTIDPDVLEGTFGSPEDAPPGASMTIIYCSCEVTVTPREVHVRAVDDAAVN